MNTVTRLLTTAVVISLSAASGVAVASVIASNLIVA